ncbi:MAG: N-acetyltransferase [Candidatus Magasanikbacteria bacterium CG_4_10_14_0_8_um_filter_32_14]|uniref:N-acetyltransferase n=1 Tax=Candidatus Magasanikbacteria bacterium CG_4_10_14_0_8_um_filter_32_14 TaxID=1974640 RepID=A0A2M7RA81_9BACT|nr:MAG: N-acetyltransferase [Candidatus Magasanikbacteria bacterium CG_4_10_14_0_8_um_filter_32_14]
MSKITIRYQKVSDAKRFYEILSNPNFIYFPAKPKSVADEKKWLQNNPKRRKNNSEWNYTVLCDNQIVGTVGIKVNPRRKYIGEIGYFLDENFWNKGIMTKAVRLAEKEGFKKIGLTRIEILMQPKNKASEKVAIKCGYTKEGLLKKAIVGTDGKKKDALLYAKVL